MSFKNLTIIKTPECTRGEMAMMLDGHHIGFVADMTEEDNGSWKLDGIIMTKGPKADYILAIEFIDGWWDLAGKGAVTVGFTKKIVKLWGRSGPGWNSRFFRGYYEKKEGGIYDASDKLMYDDARDTRAGELMNYPTAISRRAVGIIRRFGIIKPYSRRGRFARGGSRG